jgi:CYTH domain-containing protein
MPVTRRFIIASPFARLIHRERGSENVTEGHFVPQAERQSSVRFQGGRAHLILTSFDALPEAGDDITDLPRVHAEALLDVSAGRVEFLRSRLPLGSHEALVDRLAAPGALDLVSVEFVTKEQAAAFAPPVWFSAEVTQDDSYTLRSIALSGLPQEREAAVSDVALNALLDAIEGVQARVLSLTKTASGEESTYQALRRLATLPDNSAPHPVLEEAALGEVTDLKPKRPVMQTRVGSEEGCDERMVSVLDSLSEALGHASFKQEGQPA